MEKQDLLLTPDEKCKVHLDSSALDSWKTLTFVSNAASLKTAKVIRDRLNTVEGRYPLETVIAELYDIIKELENE